MELVSHKDRQTDEHKTFYKLLRARLQIQRQKVKRAECLLNFSVDYMYPDALRGLTFEFFGGYVLSAEDSLWLHPAMNKSTTVFRTGSTTGDIDAKLKQIKAKIRAGWCVEGDERNGGGDQSVGLYYVENTDTDDTFTTTKEYRIVVEHVPNIDRPPLKGTLDDWLTEYESIVGAIDTFTQIQDMVQAVFPAATKEYHKITNTFFRSAETIVYVNYANVVGIRENYTYMKLHPTVGFMQLSLQANRRESIIVAASIGFNEHITSWGNMSDGRLADLRRKITWTSDKPFHCLVQRSTNPFTSEVDKYLGAQGLYKSFSPNNLHTVCVICGSSDSKTTPNDILSLSPKDSPNVPFPIDDLMSHIVANYARVADDGHDLFNPEYLTPDKKSLRLPEDALASLCLP